MAGNLNFLILELPDTSIADTSTEDLDSSQNKEETAADVIQVAESSPKPDEAVHQPMEVFGTTNSSFTWCNDCSFLDRTNESKGG